MTSGTPAAAVAGAILPSLEDHDMPVPAIAPLLANTIRAVFDNGSVTSLFDGSA